MCHLRPGSEPLPDGAPPRPGNPGGEGHRFDFGDLAKSLEAIADKGAAAFYEGPLAVAIDREMRAAGGRSKKTPRDGPSRGWIPRTNR